MADDNPKGGRRGKSRRHLEPESGREEDTSWLLVYLDVITLLLILFVVLIAILDPDPDDEQEGDGILTGMPAVLSEDNGVLEGRPDISPDIDSQIDLPFDAGDDDMEMLIEDEYVSFRFDDEFLFQTGEASLQPAGQAAISELVPMLMQTDARISVEGHTDNIPISTLQFPSNWELSSARASSVLRFLIDEGVQPERLRAIGYGDIEPIASNDSAEGRARNRRVEITVHVRPGPEAERLRRGGDS